MEDRIAKDDAALDLTPTLLLRAYAAGIFPMADSAETEEVFWVDPQTRGILPLDGFHLPRTLAKRIRRGGFEVSVDRAFMEVVDSCADRAETWINGEIRRLYIALHRMGYAHSVEVWMEGRLAGGLYGVRLGAVFFGESMFHRRSDASKIALVWLVARLRAGGFALLDAQFTTEHLERFGAISIGRTAYHRRLDAGLRRKADFFALDEDADVQRVLQLISQTS